MCAHRESPRPQQMPRPREGRHPPRCSAHLWNKEAKKAQAEVFFPPPLPPTHTQYFRCPWFPSENNQVSLCTHYGRTRPCSWGFTHQVVCVSVCLSQDSGNVVPATNSLTTGTQLWSPPYFLSIKQSVCCTSQCSWQCFNLHLKMLVKG